MIQKKISIMRSKKLILAFVVFLVFSGFEDSQASSTATDKPYAKVSFAALNALNFTEKEAVSIFGGPVKVDSSKAGPITGNDKTHALTGSLDEASKGLGGKKLDTKSLIQDLASCGSTKTKPDLIAVGSTFTFVSANNLFIGMLTSLITPAAGDGRQNALTRISKSDCLFQGVNSALAKVFSGSKSGFTFGTPITLNNPRFPTGTYGLLSKATAMSQGISIPLYTYLFLAGKGNKVASYELIVFSIAESATESKSSIDDSKILSKMENSVIEKITSASPTSN